jgi:hypothetical protein
LGTEQVEQRLTRSDETTAEKRPDNAGRHAKFRVAKNEFWFNALRQIAVNATSAPARSSTPRYRA